MKKKISAILSGGITLAFTLLLFTSAALSQTINTIAGTGTGGFSGDGAAATAAQLRSPSCVKLDGSGNIYIADNMNHCVRKIDASGVITTIAGTGTAGFSGDGGAATAAQFSRPYALAIDGSGNIYVSDFSNNRIRKINSAGIITTIAGTGTGSYTGDGGAATAATIKMPSGINLDGAGNIYFAEEGNSVIRKITVSSGNISTIAGTGFAGYSIGVATASMLRQPKDVAVDASGNVYIADQMNHRVRMVNTSGTIVTLAGDGTGGFTGDGYAATASRVNRPYSVWVDATGNLLVSDLQNQRVRKIYLAGVGHIATIAGNGLASLTGDGGPATAAGIYEPAGAVADASGAIYVAEQGNSRIRKIAIVAPPPPVFIAGTTAVCQGATTTLVATASGGTWSSSAPAIASIDAAGLVTGVAAGSAIITYTTSSSMDTALMVVNPLPASITGGTSLCSGNTTTLASATTGGTWSSGSAATAGVDASGVVTGTAAGTAAISYTLLGCSRVVTVTVNAAPAAITGVPTVCVGATTALSCATTGGSWASSAAASATVDGVGVVTGVAAGTATISYILASGCHSTSVVSINDCPTYVGSVAYPQGSVRIHPNPSSGSFSVELPVVSAQARIIVANIMGATIYTATTSQSSSVICTLGGVVSGTYFLTVIADGQVYKSKLVIAE